VPGIILAGGGCSSNVHHPWQQQQRLMQQAVGASPKRAKRPADPAAEQLAAQVLAAHKVRFWGFVRAVWEGRCCFEPLYNHY